MQKFLVMMMAFVLTIGAQAQQDDGMDAMLAAMIAAKIHQDSIDTSSLVAVYDYECQTQDADGKAVTDKMKVCLQVGQHCTRSYPYRKFREDTEGYECLASDNLPLLRAESFCFMPEVWTNYPDGKVTVRRHRADSIRDVRNAETHQVDTQRRHADRRRLPVQDGHVSVARKEVDGTLQRGHPHVGRPVETLRTAGADSQSRGRRRHPSLHACQP